jgi:hypothetical protein
MADTNNLRYFIKPKGILRVVEMVTAIIAFGTMASESGSGSGLASNNGYMNYSEFSFLVAANAIAFSFAFIFCVCYIFRQRLDLLCFFFPIFEWTMDAIVCLLVFLGSVMGAVKCNNLSDGFGNNYKCSDIGSTSDKNNLISSIVFSFFTFFILLAINVLDYFEHRDGEKTEKTAATSAPAK